jgi:hypothetical protein
MNLVYGDLISLSRLLQVDRQLGDTPLEFIKNVTSRLDTINQRTRWKTNQTALKQQLRSLIQLYNQVIFSAQQTDIADARSARQSIDTVRWRFWLAWVNSLRTSK